MLWTRGGAIGSDRPLIRPTLFTDADQCLMQSALILMAYRCIDTWPIGAVSQFFLKLIRGFRSTRSGLSVQFGCIWELSGFENGLTLYLSEVVAYRCNPADPLMAYRRCFLVSADGLSV